MSRVAEALRERERPLASPPPQSHPEGRARNVLRCLQEELASERKGRRVPAPATP